MKLTPLIAMIFLGFLCAACAPRQEQAPEAETFLPPAELIQSNVDETGISLAFRLDKLEVPTPARKTELYGEWLLVGTITHVFQGDYRIGQTFQCYWRYEYGIAAPKIGTHFIGSFKRNDKGAVYVPDNGYCFTYQEKLKTLFEQAVKNAKD